MEQGFIFQTKVPAQFYSEMERERWIRQEVAHRLCQKEASHLGVPVLLVYEALYEGNPSAKRQYEKACLRQTWRACNQ